jgi:hypothetical protein
MSAVCVFRKKRISVYVQFSSLLQLVFELAQNSEKVDVYDFLFVGQKISAFFHFSKWVSRYT